MKDEQEEFLSYVNNNLFIAENLIDKLKTNEKEGSESFVDDLINAKQHAGCALAVADCEVRKSYGDFCELSFVDKLEAINKYKEFLSSSVIWKKVFIYFRKFEKGGGIAKLNINKKDLLKMFETYDNISKLELDPDKEGPLLKLVAQQIERRNQRRNLSHNTAICSLPNLIETKINADEVQNILSKSSGHYYWSPLEVAKSFLNVSEYNSKVSKVCDEAQAYDTYNKQAGGDFVCLETLGSKNITSAKRALDTDDCYPKQDFIIAGDKLAMDYYNNEKNKRMNNSDKIGLNSELTNQMQHNVFKSRRSLLPRPFVSPLAQKSSGNEVQPDKNKPDSKDDPRLEKLNKEMVASIMGEILEDATEVTWDNIAGLEHAKNIIKETVVWPMLRPDIFTGIRGPPKGILLFGPPGTGKTLIGKFIASQCKATFFSISSSSLTSKWIGEGEKMVRTLFTIARIFQPSVIFIDEVDSLLSQRNESEVEATRRIKTEFLVQFDGCNTKNEDRVLLIGATNRPDEIDEAARRRFRKKLYIPLPEKHARASIIKNLISQQKNELNEDEIQELVSLTEGYSGFDVDGLVREAALGPIREISDICSINTSELRPISKSDFIEALTQIKASVSDKDMKMYENFNVKYGSASK